MTLRPAGGIWVDRPLYSTAAKENAHDYIKRMRTAIELPRTDAMAGVRFNNDDSVFIRLESMYDEAEFKQFPMACVEAALIDAAQSDFWYAHEVSYEHEVDEGPEEADSEG